MNNLKKVGIVTVTYNSETVINEFISSVLGLSYENYILYIIDNASSDQTLSILERYKDERFTIIQNPLNVGVAAANNQGIANALNDQCEYVLLINNDTEFESTLLEKLLSRLEKNQCDIAIPKIKYWDDQDRIWCAGGYFRRWTAWQARHYGDGDLDNKAYESDKIVEYAPTCCMLIKISVFETVGFMDEKYFVYYDDTDFCLRAFKAKLKMLYVPNINFYHKVSSLTGGNNTDFSIRYLTRNFVYYIRKHNSRIGTYFWLTCYYILLHVKVLLIADTSEIYRKKINAYKEGMQIEIN